MTVPFARRRGLLLVLLALLVLIAMLGTGGDVGANIGNLGARFLGSLIEAAPFLLLGTLASGLIDSFISPADLARWQPRSPLWATTAAAFLGLLLPVGEYGAVPVTRRLLAKGLPLPASVSFLLAAPVINLVVFAGTYVAFGIGPLLIGRFLITVLAAVGIGLVFIPAQRHEVLVADDAPTDDGRKARMAFGAGLRAALQLAGREFIHLGRYLVIGSLLGASMQMLFSQDVPPALARGPVSSVLVGQALAFLHGTGSLMDAYRAQTLAGSLTTGSLLAFLTFGSMVDIRSALLLLDVFRPKIVLYLILLPLLLALLIGVWLNLNVSFV